MILYYYVLLRDLIVVLDFQKAAAYIHEFLLKLNDESKCAELRDTLNLALLHMQKYYKFLQVRNFHRDMLKGFVISISCCWQKLYCHEIIFFNIYLLHLSVLRISHLSLVHLIEDIGVKI